MIDLFTINIDSSVPQPDNAPMIDPLLESLVVIAFFGLLPDF